MINDGNYITIQGWMRTDLNLSGNELIVYAIIYGFSQNGHGEFKGTAQYLADWVGCTRRTITSILKKLVEENVICRRVVFLENDEKRVFYQAKTPWEEMSQGCEKISQGCEKISQGEVKNFPRGCEKNTQGVGKNVTGGTKNFPIDNTSYINRDITKNTNNVHSCSESLEETPEEFFERAWQYYPNKRGKGQVSDKSKERLMSHGWDNVKRAIDRYLEDLKKDEWRKAQNGSTFFNSGYIDYLDENYTPPMNPKLDYSKTDLDDLF